MMELLKLDERALIADALQRAAAESRARAAEMLDSETPPSTMHLHKAQIETLGVRAQKQEQLAQRMREAESVSIINMKRRGKR